MAFVKNIRVHFKLVANPGPVRTVTSLLANVRALFPRFNIQNCINVISHQVCIHFFTCTAFFTAGNNSCLGDFASIRCLETAVERSVRILNISREPGPVSALRLSKADICTLLPTWSVGEAFNGVSKIVCVQFLADFGDVANRNSGGCGCCGWCCCSDICVF